MAYTKTNWVSGETPLSASNMNNIEAGIEALDDLLSPAILIDSYSPTAFFQVTPGDNTIYISFNEVPKNYTAGGIIGVQTSGTGSSKIRLRAFGISSGGSQAFLKVYSEATSTLTELTVNVTVLWVKTAIAGSQYNKPTVD